MKKPIIAIMPLYDSARSSYWMLPGYPDAVEAAGGAPVMLPLTDDEKLWERYFALADGLLFTGGQDVSPSLYGESETQLCGEICAARDRQEKRLLELALAQDKPFFGICRGIQLLNAVLGGTLWQDLPSQLPSGVIHSQKPPYDAPSHSVRIDCSSPLFALINTPTLGVNSYHHQAIRTLAPPLQAMAYASDGVVEAVCEPEKTFAWAVQWHPEYSFRSDAASIELMRAFVRAAAKRA